MSATSDLKKLTKLIERQARTTEALTHADSFHNIAGVIASNMLSEDGQFITINLTDYAPDGELTRFRTVASANRAQSFDTSASVPLTFSDLGARLTGALKAAKVGIIEDVREDGEVSQGFKEWLGSYKVKALTSLPIRHNGKVYGLIGINSSVGALNLSDHEIAVYQTIADQVGSLVQLHNLIEEATYSSQVSERQARAFAELTSGQELAQMASIVARHMLPMPGRYISLSKFVYNLAGNITSWKVLATANRERSYDWDHETTDWASLTPEVQQSVLEGRPFVVEDTSRLTPSDIGPGFYAMLVSNGVKAFVSIPMMIDNKPVASLGVASRIPYAFTQAEIAAFSNLADQIGALIYARTLLDEAQTAREIANNLVLANRLITAADNYEDMAQAAIYTIARSMSAAVISLFDQPAVYEAQPTVQTVVAIGTPDGALAVQSGAFQNRPPTAEQIENMKQGIPLILANIQADDSPLSEATQTQYARLNVNWSASFGLRAGEQLLGTLDILDTQARSFSPEETDAYSTLADQIGIALEKRLLLQQTEETLTFVQEQFEATSKLYSAKNNLEILEAIYKFAGTDYNHVQLGLVNGENQPWMVGVLGEINHGQITAVTRDVRLDSYPAWEALSALETLYIPEVKADEFLTPAERERLLAQGIHTLMIVPLVSAQRLVGLITFMHNAPRSIPASRLRALRNMGDQAAVVFENQSLLKSTAQSLDETRRLYEINRSILAAQDTLDILRALREHIAPDAAAINHMRVKYNGEQIQDISIGYINSLNDEQVGNFTVSDMVGAEQVATIGNYLNTTRSPVILVENVDTAAKQHPMADFFSQNSAKSAISIPIRDHNVVRQVVNLLFSYEQTFTTEQRRLYEALGDQISIVLQSHSLLRDAQVSASQLSNQVRVLQIVNQLAVTLSSVQEESDLLDHSARAITEATGVDHCGILIVNPQETLGTVVAEYPALGTLNLQIDVTNNELYHLIRDTRQPVISDDIQKDARVTKATKENMKSLGIQGLAFFPIFVHDRLYGSIGLDVYKLGRTFTPEVLSIAQTIVSQTAIGLQNLRLLNDAQRRAEQLQRIAAFNQSVQATLDMATIFNIMLNESVQMLPQDQVSISLYDPTSGVLRLVAHHTDDYTSVNLNSTDVVPINGPIEKVWETWELLYIPDTRSAPEKLGSKVTSRSLIIAPLISHGRILGTVSIGSLRPYLYTETDVAVFNQMVNQLAIAIENAEAFKQSQRVAKNEALVNEISTQLQRQLDIHSMLDVTVNELGKVLGARKARIRLRSTAPNPSDE
jgi:GAF domain-containing protein